jgi:serine/threonine protein kinase/tetratricopeptide (TPR) repeat protein
MSEVLDRLKAALADRYTVERELGSGGMAVVYLAQDLRHERRVAIKALRPELTSVVAAERFLREIKLTAALAHPHILPVHDSGEADGFLYYVMPYVEGESLREKLNREKQLPVDEAVRIAREVADALSYAHEQKLLHRDIKPENVLLEAGHAVVADFGIARALSEAAGDRLTDTGVSIGTPAYMSPEQAAGEREIGEGSDLYSLACVLYEMLTGEPPITDPSVQKVVSRKMLGDFRAVSEVRREVPSEVDAAVSRALATEPADRSASVGEFADALGATIRVEQGKGSKRRWALWAALSAVALLGGLIWYVGWGRSTGPVPDSKSIAVLPLANMSANPEDQYFTDGIHDAIIEHLAKIADLRVISRTSVMEYRNTTKNIRQVAEELGVATVLEGGVQRAGGQIRIAAQLIAARTDEHLWVESYERQLTAENVFAIQSDVAQQIAAALRARLAPAEREQIEKQPTENLEAYDHYLRALDVPACGDDWRYCDQRIQLLERAVELDSSLALAYAALSETHNEMFYQLIDRSTERLERARRTAERALQLDPDLSEAYWALERYYRYVGDEERAGSARQEGMRLEPNSVRALTQKGWDLLDEGRVEEAKAAWVQALARDPRDYRRTRNVAGFFHYLHDYENAERYYDRAIGLNPNPIDALVYKALLYLAWSGDTAKARATLPVECGDETWGLHDAAMRLCNEARYEQRLSQMWGEFVEEGRTSSVEAAQYFILKAWWHGRRGEAEQERAAYESARSILEVRLSELPDDANLHSGLGIAYAGLGRRDEAIREGLRGVELEADHPLYQTPSRVLNLARIYMMVGDYDSAVGQLETLPTDRGLVTPAWLGADPLWAPLRDHPRFQALLEELE